MFINFLMHFRKTGDAEFKTMFCIAVIANNYIKMQFSNVSDS